MRVLQAVAILALLAVAAFAQSQQTGFQTVISDLASFQTKSGGFASVPGEQPTLEATADALFLASVYGLLDKIDLAAVSKFVDTLKTEGVTAQKAGLPATSTSVRDGLLLSGYLGASSDKAAVEKFLRSLLDSEANLFASRPGGQATAKATAEVLEALSLAGLSSRDWASKAIANVKETLTALVKEEGSARFFDFSTVGTGSSSDREQFESNSYALIAAQYAGVALINGRSFAQYYMEKQHARIGGFVSAPGAMPTVESTSQAIVALHALSKVSGYDAIASINAESMMQTLYPLPHDLHKSFVSHFAFSRLSNFKDVFHTDVMFHTPTVTVIDAKNPVIVQGTPVSLFVIAYPWNQPHSGLNVEAVVSHSSGVDKKYKLIWNPERFGYATEELFETKGKLGALSVSVSIGVQTPGEAVGFQVTRQFNIGYTMTAKNSAKIAGREVNPGDAVSVGTEFSHSITLADNSGPLTSGAFSLVMQVLDSSNVVVNEVVRDFKSSGASGLFNFELKQANLPAGALTFKFFVRDHATNTVHSQSQVHYELQLAMVASQIKIGSGASLKPEFKLGDEAVVSIVPASFPDLVTLHTYATIDETGEDVTNRRAFFLDTHENGQVLRSFAGVASKDIHGNLHVTFTVSFPAVFDAIGVHSIQFRYSPAEGRDVILANYDSAANELFEDHAEIGFIVKSDLVVSDIVDAPKGGSLNYGDPVKFSFKVKDRLTGEYVASYGGSSVFLALSHGSGSKAHVSARHAATIDPRGGFEVDWTVNPNAIAGAGVLELHASVLGGSEIALPTEGDKPFAVKVNIGGEIRHTATVKQVSVPTASHGAALIQFSLTCQGRVLTGALLTAAIHKNGALVAHAPVSRSDDDASYSVSWSLPEADASSAQYSIAIHRQADQASESPLFTIPVAFVGATTHYLPFRTEAVVLTLAFASFGLFSYRKWLIESRK